MELIISAYSYQYWNEREFENFPHTGALSGSLRQSLLPAKPSVLSTKPSVLATTPSVLATKLSVLSTKPLSHQLKFYEVIKHTLHGGLRRLGFSLDDIAPLDKNGFLHESQGLASKRISPSKNPQFSHYRRERGGSSHRLR